MNHQRYLRQLKFLSRFRLLFLVLVIISLPAQQSYGQTEGVGSLISLLERVPEVIFWVVDVGINQIVEIVPTVTAMITEIVDGVSSFINNTIGLAESLQNPPDWDINAISLPGFGTPD